MIRSFLNKFILSGHERSIKIKKNILLLFLLKGANIAVSVFMVPLTLNYLTTEKYGVWVTLTSIIAWFTLFDIGLGNGLRNKFVEMKSTGKAELIRIYISTTYLLISSIAIVLLLLFSFINIFLPWQDILNTTSIGSDELKYVASVIFLFFSIRFIVDLISTILTADQKPASSSFLVFISNLASFVALYILAQSSKDNLLYVALLLSGIPVGVLILANIHFFNGIYSEYKPSLKFFDFTITRSLASLGIQFFVIQIAGIILFATSNIIIIQLFGPESVTPYNIASRYIGFVLMAFTMVLTPFWSAYTEAYQKNDIAWIKHTTKRVLIAWFVFVICIVILVLISPFVYSLWIGEQIIVPYIFTIFMGLYAIISMWNGIFANFINGVGKVRLQFVSSIVIGVVNIPLSIILAKYVFKGPEGVILSTCLCLLVGSIWAPIQYHKIVNGTAKGIWDK